MNQASKKLRAKVASLSPDHRHNGCAICGVCQCIHPDFDTVGHTFIVHPYGPVSQAERAVRRHEYCSCCGRWKDGLSGSCPCGICSNKLGMSKEREVLANCRRRLGELLHGQELSTSRMGDTELARQMIKVIDVLDDIVKRLDS